MTSAARPAKWKIVLAFSIIYLVWGSTFLAIRIGVNEVPPFLLAALRFFVAGIAMYAWLRATGTPSPSQRQWFGSALLGGMIFVVDYGCLFWSEQRVPSGIAAVVLIPSACAVRPSRLPVAFIRWSAWNWKSARRVASSRRPVADPR